MSGPQAKYSLNLIKNECTSNKKWTPLYLLFVQQKQQFVPSSFIVKAVNTKRIKE